MDNSTLQYLNCRIKETTIFESGVFYIIVNLLDFNEEPVYKIAIFDWKPRPQNSEWDPLNIECLDKAGALVKVNINFNVNIFPHTPIDPNLDSRFKEQSWSENFKNVNGLGITANFREQDMYEILSYIEKISKMKAFF